MIENEGIEQSMHESIKRRSYSADTIQFRNEPNIPTKNIEHKLTLIIASVSFLILASVAVVVLIYTSFFSMPNDYYKISKYGLICMQDKYFLEFNSTMNNLSLTELIGAVNQIKVFDLSIYSSVLLSKFAKQRWNDPVRIFKSYDNYTCVIETTSLYNRHLKSCNLLSEYSEQFIYDVEDNSFLIPSTIHHFSSICNYFRNGTKELFTSHSQLIPIIEKEFSFFIQDPQEIPQLYILGVLDQYYHGTSIIEEQDVFNLQEMLGFEKPATLLYKTNGKDYRNIDFHTHVDNHSQLLIAIQVNHYNKIYKFGAYISVKYEKNSNYKNYIRDDYAFLFTLDSNENARSMKYIIKDPKKAVRYDDKLGIRIGEGTDLGIEERIYDTHFFYNHYMYPEDSMTPIEENSSPILSKDENEDPNKSSTNYELLTSTPYGSVWSKFGDGSYDYSSCESYNCKLFGNKKETSRYITSRFTALEVFTFETQS